MGANDSEARTIPTISVTVLYFARLRESLGLGSERIELPGNIVDVDGLRDWLRARGGAWADELAPERVVRVAVNQEMAAPASPLRGGDEIAFFPPVTGG
jgi:molybdopterin synthase sulfur carrier subunit